MKRLIISLVSIFCLTLNMSGYTRMSLSELRQNARLLSDRMAYELNLSNAQYQDVYEINYDFFSEVNRVMDGVVYGYESDVDYYYECLDYRNEDLSYVLSRSQYLSFANKDYFYRPFYTNGGNLLLRILNVYSDLTHFYYSLPNVYFTYCGGHNRSHYAGGFYTGRYRQSRYSGPLCNIRGHHDYNTHRWNDFHFNPNSDRNGSRYGNNHRQESYHSKPAKPNNGNRSFHFETGPQHNSQPDRQMDRDNGSSRSSFSIGGRDNGQSGHGQRWEVQQSNSSRGSGFSGQRNNSSSGQFNNGQPSQRSDVQSAQRNNVQSGSSNTYNNIKVQSGHSRRYESSGSTQNRQDMQTRSSSHSRNESVRQSSSSHSTSGTVRQNATKQNSSSGSRSRR